MDGKSSAGILYFALLPLLLPVALAAAWGLDRLDGSRGSPAAHVILLIALASLAAGAVLLPRFTEWCVVDEGRPWAPGPVAAFAAGARFGSPFATYDVATKTIVMLPLDDLFCASAAMMLLCAAASAVALRQLGRGLVLLTPGRVGLMFLLQACLTAMAMPRFGLAGAPLAACAALLLACLPIAFQAAPRPRPADPPLPVSAP